MSLPRSVFRVLRLSLLYSLSVATVQYSQVVKTVLLQYIDLITTEIPNCVGNLNMVMCESICVVECIVFCLLVHLSTNLFRCVCYSTIFILFDMDFNLCIRKWVKRRYECVSYLNR